MDMGRASDDLIDRHAQATGAILVTRDLDFADTRAYPPEAAPGRLVLRVADNDTGKKGDGKKCDRFIFTLMDHAPAGLDA